MIFFLITNNGDSNLHSMVSVPAKLHHNIVPHSLYSSSSNGKWRPATVAVSSRAGICSVSRESKLLALWVRITLHCVQILWLIHSNSSCATWLLQRSRLCQLLKVFALLEETRIRQVPKVSDVFVFPWSAAERRVPSKDRHRTLLQVHRRPSHSSLATLHTTTNKNSRYTTLPPQSTEKSAERSESKWNVTKNELNDDKHLELKAKILS